MFQIKETKEILSTKIWCINPTFVKNIHPLILSYLNRTETNDGVIMKEKDTEEPTIAKIATQLMPKLHVQSKDLLLLDHPQSFFSQLDEDGISDSDFYFINFIDIRSSITRYGGWCSCGSIDHRDQMIFCSKKSNCIGHIFIIDTPGGSAYAMNDYQLGISAARAAGQPVISFIDGSCCSAGVAAACQTDEVYAAHPNSEIGCIGVMGAFSTMADGTERGGYVYHELYDPESFDKNKAYRDIANDNDSRLLLEELASLGVEFRSLVVKNRPAIKEEALHGKTYRAQDMLGVLVDAVMSLEDVIQRLCDIHEGASLISHFAKNENDDEDDNNGNDEGRDDIADNDNDDYIPPTSVPKGSAPINFMPKPTYKIKTNEQIQEH